MLHKCLIYEVTHFYANKYLHNWKLFTGARQTGDKNLTRLVSSIYVSKALRYKFVRLQSVEGHRSG